MMREDAKLGPAVREAIEILEQFEPYSEIRQIYDSRLRAKVDQKTREAVAEEGGRRKAIEVGQRFQTEKTAKEALQMGLNLEIVERLTGLTKHEILKITKK